MATNAIDIIDAQIARYQADRDALASAADARAKQGARTRIERDALMDELSDYNSKIAELDTKIACIQELRPVIIRTTIAAIVDPSSAA